MILVSLPCRAVIVLCNSVFNPKTIDGIFHIFKFSFIGKLGVMIADDD